MQITVDLLKFTKWTIKKKSSLLCISTFWFCLGKINNLTQSSQTFNNSEESKKNLHENEFLLKNNSIRDSTIEQKIPSSYSENHTKVNDWIDFQLHPTREGSPYFNVNKNSPLDKMPQNIKNLSNT